MNASPYAGDLVYVDTGSKGTIADLLEAVEENEHMESAAMILVDEIAEIQPWSEAEDEKNVEDDDDHDSCSIEGLKVTTSPAEQVSLHNFRSAIPNLPEEPLLEDEVAIVDPDQENHNRKDEDEKEEQVL